MIRIASALSGATLIFASANANAACTGCDLGFHCAGVGARGVGVASVGRGRRARSPWEPQWRSG